MHGIEALTEVLGSSQSCSVSSAQLASSTGWYHLSASGSTAYTSPCTAATVHHHPSRLTPLVGLLSGSAQPLHQHGWDPPPPRTLPSLKDSNRLQARCQEDAGKATTLCSPRQACARLEAKSGAAPGLGNGRLGCQGRPLSPLPSPRQGRRALGRSGRRQGSPGCGPRRIQRGSRCCCRPSRWCSRWCTLRSCSPSLCSGA